MNNVAKPNSPLKRRALRWGIFLAFGLVLASGLVYWWSSGGREQVILLLQPDFRVTNIDQQSGTMTLNRPGETVIVSCASVCDVFTLGKKYSMMNRGGVLEFKSGERKLQLPILEQQLKFEKPPGGQG